MKLLALTLLTSGLTATTHFKFSIQSDDTIRLLNDNTRCLTTYGNKKLKFNPCNSSLKQKWQLAPWGPWNRIISKYYQTNPSNGMSQFCITAGRNKVKYVKPCNAINPSAIPEQYLGFFGKEIGEWDEQTISMYRNRGQTRKCLSVKTTDYKIKVTECDTSTCNVGRTGAAKCTSCAWRRGFNDKCERCQTGYVLTVDGDCVLQSAQTDCKSKYPMVGNKAFLRWSHPQDQYACATCDPNDNSKCTSCTANRNTGYLRNGKCSCKDGGLGYAWSGGFFAAYLACNDAGEGQSHYDPNYNCKNNQWSNLSPESKCKSCVWDKSSWCMKCKVKGAVVKASGDGNRQSCECPGNTTFNGSNRCV